MAIDNFHNNNKDNNKSNSIIIGNNNNDNNKIKFAQPVILARHLGVWSNNFR